MSVISNGRPERKDVTEQLEQMKRDWDEKQRKMAEERAQKASGLNVVRVAQSH